MSKLILFLLLSPSAVAATEMTGKIVLRQGVDYLTSAPGKGVAEFLIQWRSVSAHPRICYADVDMLCPSYQVYFSRLSSSGSGAVLMDAMAIPAP